MYIWERVAKSWKHGTVLYIIIKSQERPYNNNNNNNNIFIKIIIIKSLINNNNNNNIFMWPTVHFAHLRSKKHLQNASNTKKMFFTCPTAIGLALSTFKAKHVNHIWKIAEMGQDMWKILSMVNWMGAMFTWLLVVLWLHPQETKPTHCQSHLLKICNKIG